MSKTYKGYELIKAISEGRIKTGAKIYFAKGISIYRFYTIYGEYRQLHLWREEKGKKDVLVRTIDSEDLMEDFKVEDKDIIDELIEDEIDIQAIEEFKSEYTMNNVEFQIQDKLNELVQAVKQLDNKGERVENGFRFI